MNCSSSTQRSDFEERVDFGGIAVSPDHRTILFSKTDAAGSDLMLVENFR